MLDMQGAHLLPEESMLKQAFTRTQPLKKQAQFRVFCVCVRTAFLSVVTNTMVAACYPTWL
jgi:hypothetical protein